MKKTIIAITTTIIMLLTMSIPCFASNTNSETKYEYFADGSYAVIETVITAPVSTASVSAESTSTKSGATTYTYYNALNVKQWAMTLNATFEYTGSSATATKSSVSYNIYVSSWSCSSKSATKSGATAKATATFKKSATTKTKSIGLKCSKTGTISTVDYD